MYLTSAQALRASCACTSTPLIVAGAVVCAACRAPIFAAASSGPRTYSQADRPPGCGPSKYLRAHRERRAAGDPEVWAEGRARLMTASAWARAQAALDSKARPRSPKVPAPADSTPEDSMLDLLGLQRVAS